ncbi:hypothetical protein U1E44_07720 [Arenibacter sp. GZD96]|uniref:hypothetical protein n=1 Tax=Aurantibrevibacter litoralis TaxID=3106030 RepID=UPI002AFF503D|nr:hypothetical protein [Arenibacter sp. GZD-96]MEA1785973.1 hypothetical protein [Arenibacter sp. GZD-96]
MKPKIKALWFNFISFAIIFVILRMVLGYSLPKVQGVFLAVASALFASLLAPKFWPSKTNNKVLVKWVFRKKIWEV